MDVKERTGEILDKIMEVASAANNATENEQRIAILEENYAILMECILEMSEIVYA